ncbi:MAG TPA: hypothetical protein VFQ53_06805 [Kofleriaceae bacterium]|nr:hypothetical protein [Kofleriaceae bacterium]
MTERKQLLGGQTATLALTLAAAIMAAIALGASSTAATAAYTGLARESAFIDGARHEVFHVSDATRGYVASPTAGSRARLVELQKEITAYMERLADRVDASDPRNLRISELTGAWMTWVTRLLESPVPAATFELELVTYRSRLEHQLDELQVAAHARSDRRLQTARDLARRAQVGVLVIAVLATVIGMRTLARMSRRLINPRRAAVIVEAPRHQPVPEDKRDAA